MNKYVIRYPNEDFQTNEDFSGIMNLANSWQPVNSQSHM